MLLTVTRTIVEKSPYSSLVQQTKGPHWEVPTGRRDGTRSVKDDAVNNLPPPFFDATRNLYQFFIPKGLDAKDQVVLLGIYYSSLTSMFNLHRLAP